MSTNPEVRKNMGLTGALLLGLAFLLWAALVANVRSFGSSDAAGNGLAVVYAVGTVIVLWIALAALLLVAALRGQMPGVVRIAAVVLVPLSGAAALGAIQLLSGRGTPGWPIVIPVLVPPLIIAYAAWVMLPTLRAALPSGVVGSVVWGAVLLLSLTPWVPIAAGKREVAERRAQIDAEAEVRQREEDAKKEAERRARFAKLGPESRLWDWIDFADARSDLREDALAGARKLTHRQEDAETMAERGFSSVVRDAPYLDLTASPQFCEGARKVLSEQAQWLRPEAAEPQPFAPKAAHVDGFIPAIRWLAEQGCDATAEVNAIAASLRMYEESPELARALETLTGLGQRRGG